MTPSRIPASYAPASKLLDGKSILVTGATAGIGRAAAICYANHGATVIICGRDNDKLERLYDEIEALGAPQPGIVELDLSTATEDSYRHLCGNISAGISHLDGLLLNASMLGDRKPIESYSYRSWLEVMQVNVNAQFLMAKEMLPLLKSAPSASMLLSSSGVGRRGRAYWGAYSVSKFAIEGLTQILASELENISSVRVNCINPGATNTAMRRAAYPAENPGDNPDPEAIMAAYLYLMGDDSHAITGQSFDAQ